MAWSPGVEYRGDRYIAEGMPRAASALAGAITDYRTRKRSEGETDAASQTIFETGLTSRDANGNPLVSESEKQRFFQGDPNTRKGIAAGIAARIQQNWQEREAKMRWDRDPLEGQPQPLVLPDGSVVPNRYYIPGARSVIDATPRAETPAPERPAIGQEVFPGFIWNGRALIPLNPRNPKVDALSEMKRKSEIDRRKSQRDSLDQEIATVTGEVAAGNRRPGPDWLPWLTTPHAEQLRRLEARRDSLAASGDDQLQLLPGGGVPIETDPATGMKFYRDETGRSKPLPNQFQPLEPTGREAPAQLPSAAVVPKDVLDQARDAIQRGAPREAVAARLREMGVDPSGL